jgi:IPT/TIG domain
MGFLYDPSWYAIDSPRGLADQAKVMLAALGVYWRDELKLKLSELVRRASDVYESRFPDGVDRTAISLCEWVMRDRPKVATLECRFCRKVLDELRRPRADGFSIDWVAWDVERADDHCETCALGVLAGTAKPVQVAKTVTRTRAQLAKLPMRFELDTYHGDIDYDVKVTVFGEGFTNRRVEVWFGEHRAKILKRVSDSELRVVQPFGYVGLVPVRVKIDGKTTELPQQYYFVQKMY